MTMDAREFEPIGPEARLEPYVPPQKLRERGWRQMKKIGWPSGAWRLSPS